MLARERPGSSVRLQLGSEAVGGDGMSTDPTLAQAVARQLLLGRRESLTIASHLHCSVEAVNAALQVLRADCDACIALTQPYGQQPRFVVDVLRREPLTRVAWPTDPR